MAVLLIISRLTHLQPRYVQHMLLVRSRARRHDLLPRYKSSGKGLRVHGTARRSSVAVTFAAAHNSKDAERRSDETSGNREETYTMVAYFGRRDQKHTSPLCSS